MEATRHSSHAVEIILDSYRVTGDLMAAGGPRRLVDILNAYEEPSILIREAVIDCPVMDGAPVKQCDAVQVHMPTILFAIPVGDDVKHEDPFESVRKVPIDCTIVLPGYEIAGKIHMIEEVVPSETPLLGARHFVALTDATITSLFNRSRSWTADVVVVNVGRAVLFAPGATVAAAA